MMRCRVLFIVSVLFLSCFSNGQRVVYSLNGLWQLRDESGEYENLVATVPGGIYSDLMVNEVLDDIYFGFNDVNYKWVAISVSEELAAKQAENYPIPPDCVPDSYKGECHVNFIRKIPASFSWDWGPAFPSVGIWKEIYLTFTDSVIITDVVAEVLEGSDSWTVSVNTYFDIPTSGNLTVEVETEHGYYLVNNYITLNEPDDFGEVVYSADVEVPKSAVNLWWPNGYGSQSLYPVIVTFWNEETYEGKNAVIGFRKIEIVQDKLEYGRSFYFKVNDLPIFTMGVNVIPFDILPEKSYDGATLDRLLGAVAASGANMVRVWGGGVYESDNFYNLADKYGLMVWQDFVFASSMYPANEDFLNNVRKEVNYQVKRIQSHASLALWGGNNENEGNLASNYFGTDDNLEVYKKDYINLYIKTIRDELLRVTKNANFVDSSPTNGIESDNEGYLAKDPNSNYYGDKHYYSNKKDGFDVKIYPTPRFASEYGYQSLPSISSWLTVTNNLTDLNINSDFMKHRQHHPDGNEPLKNLIEFQLELPSEDNEFYDEAFIYYTQIIQAMSIKTETEHYRRYMGRLDNTGQGFTMGALFWQLNDVWVGPSWSSIEYTGKWKMLQYFVPKFFSQELVTGHYNNDKLEIYYMVNQELGDSGKKITMTVYNYESFEPVNVIQFTGEFKALIAGLVAVIEVEQHLVDISCGSEENAKNNCFLTLQIGDEENSLNYFFPSKLKEANLKNANLEVKSIHNADTEGLSFLITLNTDAPSLFVWLDAGNIKGHFLDNGFHQLANEHTVVFVADEPQTVDILKENLKVTHMKDPKYFL